MALDQRGTLPLARAWDLIAAAPARIMGLTDRGRLDPGMRADLAILHAETHTIEATIAGGRLAHAQGEAARRLMGSAVTLAAQ